MASSPVPESSKAEDNTHALYCSDPSCPYCKDLRAAEQHWKREREERQKTDAA
jgi:hypothetical protein